MCLDCGFDGAELQGERGTMTFVCPTCGADLYARPARSYAEMEGFCAPRESPGAGRWAPACAAPERCSARARPSRPAPSVRAVALAWVIGLLAFAGATLTILLASSAGFMR